MPTLAITGLFSPWGRRMARLASGFGMRVLGIDVKPLTRPFPGVEFVKADLRNPLLAELFKTEEVDIVLHCAFRWRQQRVEEVFDSNVLGMMHLLGAAAMAGVRKVIVPSSTFVYGAQPDNPAFIGEESDFSGRAHYAYVRELREIETYVSGFRRQHPHMVLTCLRFANILGGGIPSPMARFLALPAAPVLLGFDSRMQFIHHEDVLRALGHCILQDYNGVFNVAAAGPVPLLKALALAGTPPLFLLHPLAYQGLPWLRKLNRRVEAAAPLPWDFLRYTWVADTGRMQNQLGFTPAYDAETTLRRFGEQVREHRYEQSKPYRLAVEGWERASQLGRQTQQGLEEMKRRSQAVVQGARGEEGGS